MAEPSPAEFTRQLMDMANANDAMLDGTMTPVLELITANDVVFGVWQDSTRPYGVGWTLVKGANQLREIAATGASASCRITAITCIAAERAEALRRHVNTDPTH